MGGGHPGVFEVKLKRSSQTGSRLADSTQERAPLRFLVSFCVVGLLGLPLQAQLRRDLKTKDFTYPEFYPHTISPDNPTNRMKLLLRGAEGRYYSNTLVGITTARLEHYPESGKGTNLVAITPFCVLDSAAHMVSSTNWIDLIANDGVIKIHGERGFLFDMTNQFLYVSNRSRTVILHGLTQKQ